LPRLPGHGTRPEDLLDCRWQEWAGAIEEAYVDLSHECDEVFLCGLSMGGTLALNVAVNHPVAGVVTLAAPIVFPRWQQVTVRYLKHIRTFRHKKDGEDVSDTAARAYLDSYRKYPYFSIEQLFLLTNHVRHQLSRIAVPVLVVHSRQDHTVDFSNADRILEGISSEDKEKVTLERSFHIITVDCEKNLVCDAIWRFITEHSKVLTVPRP